MKAQRGRREPTRAASPNMSDRYFAPTPPPMARVDEAWKGVSIRSEVPEPGSNDYLNKYLSDYLDLCKRYRDAYNIHSVHLKNRHNFITFPLLIITSATGVIAGLDASKTAGVIVGAASAILTAIQRYCAYSERSENARMTAKSHAKIIRKIENMQLIMESKIVSTSVDMFSKFLREIQSEIDSTHENAKDVPWELLKYIDTLDTKVCCFPVAGPKSRESKGARTVEPEEEV